MLDPHPVGLQNSRSASRTRKALPLDGTTVHVALCVGADGPVGLRNVLCSSPSPSFEHPPTSKPTNMITRTITLTSACLVVCALAALITWHAVEVLGISLLIPKLRIEVFAFSPGETKNLRAVATYFVAFSVATTVGYVFSLVGTLANDWTGPPVGVRATQVLWPTIYVPLCLVLLVVPQLSLRLVVRRAKDELLVRYERRINELLRKDGGSLTASEIEQVNAIAGLMEQIRSTPNSALRLPVVLVAAVTGIVNLVTLFLPREAIAEAVRSHLP